MGRIARELGYELVMVTNQDGLGTDAFPENKFQPIQDFIIHSFSNEGISFSAVHIDRSFPADHSPMRKPGTGMLTRYLNSDQYDITGSYVIGDRITDVQLAKNLGCRALWLKQDAHLGGKEIQDTVAELERVVALETIHWSAIYSFLKTGLREVIHERNTRETKIRIELNADGNGRADIHTGIAFFDHMLDQVARHANGLKIQVQGDLQIDEHHTIEDTGYCTREAMAKALADKGNGKVWVLTTHG
jgi:imidazoleglycerol-phosphate dehydratase/histidinol-phosphatase